MGKTGARSMSDELDETMGQDDGGKDMELYMFVNIIAKLTTNVLGFPVLAISENYCEIVFLVEY